LSKKLSDPLFLAAGHMQRMNLDKTVNRRGRRERGGYRFEALIIKDSSVTSIFLCELCGKMHFGSSFAGAG
jgi:hypothetical protein